MYLIEYSIPLSVRLLIYYFKKRIIKHVNTTLYIKYLAKSANFKVWTFQNIVTT
jgi:hypothetical protein